MNTGEMCPLPEIVELRRRFKLRLILDESISFGSLGENGRGVTEHFNVDVNIRKKNDSICIRLILSNVRFVCSFQRADVDIIISSLENAVGAIGGFSVGTEFIIYNQYIHSRAHCFSASLPPFLAEAAIAAIDHLEQNPKMFGELNEKCRKLHE